MFIGLKIKVLIAVALLSALGVGAAVFYSVVAERNKLLGELAQEQALHNITKETVLVLSNQIHKQNGVIDELNKKFADVRKTTSAQLKTIRSHDLERLAARKPGLISNRINAASIKRMLAIEELTQAYSEGRDPARDDKTHARAGKAATARMANYNGPLFCVSAEGYEALAESFTEIDRYIQQMHSRCGD